MTKWDDLEGKERRGSQQFSPYFKKQYLDDLRNKTASFVMQGLGLGEDPYCQNIPESVNNMIKDWVNFLPSEIDSFILSLRDLVQSFETEEELTWFGLSDKWEVREELAHRLPKKGHMEMTTEERRVTLESLLKLCSDPEAFQRCKRFKFQSGGTQKKSADPQCSAIDPPLPTRKDLERLKGSFTEEEILSLTAKSAALIHSDAVRSGFQQGTFLVDSKRPPPNSAPYTVTCRKSGKCSCKCAFYGRNNVCHHTVAVSWKLGVLTRALESYTGRNIYSISTSTMSSAVGKKDSAGRKRKTPVEEPRQTGSECLDASGPSGSSELCIKILNPTTVVIKKAVRPEDPPPAAPLIIKRITGNIPKCAGCSRPLLSRVEGFWEDYDSEYCCGRYEAYYYWNKGSNSYQLSSGTRHYHINPVCTQMFRSLSKTISLASSIPSSHDISKIAGQRFGTTVQTT